MDGTSSSGGRRAWIVWAAGLLTYVVAVAHRSSFGVAGLEATDRFGVQATVLSLFVVVQLAVYAAMQLPMGVALDRWGPRRLLVLGSLTMTVGQLVMTFAPGVGVAIVARVLIGSGDAAIFVSAVRLVWSWFPRRRVPLLTQVTGIVGQCGQVVSALPFALALHDLGWTWAFAGLVVLGVLATVLAGLVVRDRPAGEPPLAAPSRLSGLGDTLRNPGTWLGFWTHMIGGVSANVFVLLWGVPFLVQGQGLTTAQAGGLLTLNVLVAIVAGPVIGELTARHPLRRSWIALAVATGVAAGWALVLIPSGPRPLWQLAIFVALVSVGGPASLIGLDFAASLNPPQRLGAAQSVANMGGFVSTFAVMLAVGVVLDRLAPDGAPTLDDYRVALCALPAMMAVALVGVLVTRRQARAVHDIRVPRLIEGWRRGRSS
ncbi:MFS transporter [Xylanimonas oleitrophica]|uniref:MFS transporter n=1 Tax=Xylanimonas oleitrophica TaxID=2607479 RepID=UPI0015CFF790|nr:MFS transporter [Xylanimonas oleitrophica]